MTDGDGWFGKDLCALRMGGAVFTFKGNAVYTFIFDVDSSVVCVSSAQAGRNSSEAVWAGKGYRVWDGGGEGEL